MNERREKKEQQINRMDLRPLLARDFDTSDAFVEQLGKSVTSKGMFIPMRVDDKFQVGNEIEIRFTLQGRKEIISGTVRIVFIRDGSSGETAGCGVKYLKLTDRSLKNLDMIKSWRAN